ncbi:MAG TPA: hypothetical protein VKT77_22655 [Chthonomonadaceae bacterium]|nr:hypothetical protein [Chthonomonadaceae bacterium]
MTRQAERGRADAEMQGVTSQEHDRGASDGGQSGGRGWHGDPAGHARAGSKGGKKVSADRSHMADIGRKGGQRVSQNRQHMAEIGRRGGQTRGENADTAHRRTTKDK